MAPLDFVYPKHLAKLTRDIFDGDYDKEVSPFAFDDDFEDSEIMALFYENYTANSTQKFFHYKYGIAVQLLKLVNVDETNEQMTVVMEFVQSWKDRRLTWDKKKYGNIGKITTRLEKVWSLPFIAYGASEVVEHRDQNYRTAAVYDNGEIMAQIPLRLTTNCKMNMIDFPFDTQICEIRVGLPLQSSHTFNINIILPEHILASCKLGNSAWDIVNISYGQQVVYYDDILFDNDKHAVVKLHLKRNPMFYMYMIVLPTFIINTVSIAGVFMKDIYKMDRLSVGMTHIMTMTFILTLIADKLPKTEQIPLLGQYIIFGLCTMMVAMVCSTYVKKIANFSQNHLLSTRSVFGERLRKFVVIQLRQIVHIVFQSINLFSVLYIIYRMACFEQLYAKTNCSQKMPTMDVIPEIDPRGDLKHH
ncbi:unnamed protein product [Caenorhabditis angaria]|uniref:Neurotransmitter-gated ion-channel ligand-binding domain-containing protein n=1 Tax=Caenorhabditis angaria TaxID=860376 RepID=A0A9P1IG24_9PELO|nr:unnamed protein product [Caenorhabditis angaria]